MHLFDLFEDNATEGKILHPNRINLYLNLRKPNAKPIVVGRNIPYKAMDAVIQKIVDKYSNVEADMFEFRPAGSLREDSGENDLYAAYNKILIDLCDGIIKHQKQDSDRYGLVAAAVVDPDHNVVCGINHKLADGKRVHAERAAMANYIKRHGVIPKNSIIITTLSPCTDDMPDRKGPSCTELLNGSPITRVYAGYRDPSQTHLSHDEFDVVYTQNSKIESVCKQIADCFLKESAYTDPANYRGEGMAEGESNGTAISLSKLGKFHPGADTLAEFVPERATAKYALHPDKWESTFYSLTNKDSDKLKYYGPKKISIPPGTLVGDMAIANKFYRAKTPEEQEQYAELYKQSLRPYPVDVSKYRMPELLITKQGVAENFADGKNPGRKEIDPDVYEDLSNSIIARTARQIVPTIRAKSTPEGYVYLSTQDGLSLVIGCNIAGGSIDINIGSQPMETTSSGPHKGAVTKIIEAVYQAAAKQYGAPIKQGTLSIDHDAGHGVWQHIAQKLGLQYDANMVKENFADGKNPGRKGLSKRMGVNTKASVSSLRKTAKHSTGEKARMAHWLANMKAGKAKKK